MKNRFIAPLAAAALIGGILAQSEASNGTVHAATSKSDSGPVATQQLNTPVVTSVTRNLYTLPRESQAASGGFTTPREMPLLPLGRHKAGLPPGVAPAAQAVTLPGAGPSAGSQVHVVRGFDGMADSGTICGYFGGGCQPPDMALATSPSYVFQGVNTSFSLYNTSGGIIAGPVNATNFFGVPSPTPSGCDPNGPFLSDPRAFYDPNTGLMWAAELQIEDAFGIATGCNPVSAVWIANFNPANGVMHIYRIETGLGTTNFNDFTQLGFSAKTVAISLNMFNQAGTAFAGAEAIFFRKHLMEQGLPVSGHAFSGIRASGVFIDTVQPVETETPSAHDPGVQYLVSSFNGPDASGNDCFTMPCHGFVVLAYDPGTSSLTRTLVEARNLPYISPPNADQPGCNQCIETIDNRITATPVYGLGSGHGLITFGHGTGAFNGTQTVSAVQWAQLLPVLSGGTLTSASLYQGNTLVLAGDQAASFPALMPDAINDLVMVFDTMGHFRNPSIAVTGRLATDPPGTMGSPSILKLGLTPTGDSRWGDYEAASYDGFSTNHIWVASQYSGSNTDWSTWISQVHM